MALDFLQSLVGGDESSSQQVIDPTQQAFRTEEFFPALTQLFQEGVQVSPTEQMGIEGALATAGGIGEGLVDPTQAALMQLFGAPDPSGELVQNAIQGATAPLFEQFQNVVAPEIRRSSGASGQPGGSRGTVATRLAANDLFNKVGDISSQIALQASQQGLDALQGGIGLAPQVAGLSFLPSDVQRDLGGQESTRELDFLSQIQSLMGDPVVLGSSEGTGTRGVTQGFSDIFSDRRLKRNIKKIGKLENGLNLYSYVYVWGEKAIGVMADEVRKLIPDAVKVHESGFDMVDYSKI